MSRSGSSLDKEEICFYYSEASISHSFMVDSNEKVLSVIPALFQEFIKSNSLLNALKDEAKSKLTCSILPTVASESVTFNQLRRLNSHGNPLVLVTTGDQSPLSSELMECRKNKLFRMENTRTGKDLSSVPSIKVLENEIRDLKALVLEEKLKTEIEREKAQNEREKAKIDRENAEKRFQDLRDLLTDEKLKRQKLCRRILMDKCRAKLADELTVGVYELIRFSKEATKLIPTEAFELLISHSHLRGQGNEVAHEADVNELSDCVLSCQDDSIRDSLKSMFKFIFNSDPCL